MLLDSGALYLATRGGGAWRDEVRLRVNDVEALPEARVLVSRSQASRGHFDGLDGEALLRPLGSMALKLARVAEGYGAGTFTHEVRHEWDVAAGALLVEEAGGRVTDGRGLPLEFNTPHARFAGVVASNGRVHAGLLTLCARGATKGPRGEGA
jgi:myo-inositol-1(or 4)-monophosphatase